MTLNDEREYDLPNIGFVEFMNPESGEMVLLDTGDKDVRLAFQKIQKKTRDARENLLKACGVDEIPVFTGKSYMESFIKFFKMREKRM